MPGCCAKAGRALRAIEMATLLASARMVRMVRHLARAGELDLGLIRAALVSPSAHRRRTPFVPRFAIRGGSHDRALALSARPARRTSGSRREPGARPAFRGGASLVLLRRPYAHALGRPKTRGRHLQEGKAPDADRHPGREDCRPARDRVLLRALAIPDPRQRA